MTIPVSGKMDSRMSASERNCNALRMQIPRVSAGPGTASELSVRRVPSGLQPFTATFVEQACGGAWPKASGPGVGPAPDIGAGRLVRRSPCPGRQTPNDTACISDPRFRHITRCWRPKQTEMPAFPRPGPAIGGRAKRNFSGPRVAVTRMAAPGGTRSAPRSERQHSLAGVKRLNES
jgi:hypothetical protein